jgi:hypothetical protein
VKPAKLEVRGVEVDAETRCVGDIPRKLAHDRIDGG